MKHQADFPAADTREKSAIGNVTSALRVSSALAKDADIQLALYN